MSDLPPDQNPPAGGSVPPPGGEFPPPGPGGTPPPPGYGQPAPGYGPPAGYGAAPSGGSWPGGDTGILSARWMVDSAPPPGWAPKQKMTAGLLGILLGSLGIHSFYLGNSKKGIIQIVATIFTCGILGIWGFIEGILLLVNDKGTDAYGYPLTN